MRAVLRATVLWLPLAIAAGCASPVERVADEYRHHGHGYTIAAPAPPWKPTKVEQATLAFRGPANEGMTLKSRCGRPVAGPQMMARHLLIGIEREIVEARPVPVAGESGWLQLVDTDDGAGHPLKLKTITLILDGCSFDWVLAAAPELFPAAEPVFDAWWQSFRLAPERGA
jgi:hypothetical protein